MANSFELTESKNLTLDYYSGDIGDNSSIYRRLCVSMCIKIFVNFLISILKQLKCNVRLAEKGTD